MSNHANVTSIRNYRSEDLAACRALWVELTEWHRRIYDAPEIGGDDPGLKFDEHLDRVGAERIWLATRGPDVVGMVGMIPDSGEVELEPIVVREGWRGHGIGRELAARVVAEARNAGARLVVTRPVARNTEAIRFNYGLGFDALGQVELLLDLRPAAEQRWRPGAVIAGCELRV